MTSWTRSCRLKPCTTFFVIKLQLCAATTSLVVLFRFSGQLLEFLPFKKICNFLLFCNTCFCFIRILSSHDGQIWARYYDRRRREHNLVQLKKCGWKSFAAFKIDILLLVLCQNPEKRSSFKPFLGTINIRSLSKSAGAVNANSSTKEFA